MTGVELFADLFSGRTDIYGMNQFCMKEPLTKEIYQQHIDGIRRIGVYPIHDKVYTKWLACDIDDGDFNKAREIVFKAENLDIKCYAERSKSKGFHVWCFFKTPIESVKARLVFEMFLEELEIKCEIFPKQDEINSNSPFGNFIFIPLFGGSVKEGKTVFVDTEDKLFIDNVKDLTKIETNDPKLFDEIIAENALERRVFIQPQEPGEERKFTRILPCIDNIKKGVQKGHRNEACFRLVIFFKEKGMPRDDIETLINNWNLKNVAPLPDKELVTIIESVYKGNYKGYGCEDGIISNYCNKPACPITQAQERKDQIEKGIITMVFRDPEVMVFRKKDYEYRLSGFEFSKTGKFRVSLTLSKKDKILYKDLIKLDMASNRSRFAKAADDKEIDGDLIKVEELARQQIEKEEHDRLLAPKQLYIMTEQEKVEAIKYLEETPDILYRVIETTNRMGVVGEEIVRLMIFLCYTSRITEEPLSITVKGEASSGKSFACQRVQRLIPEEGYHFITRATQNAFYHLPEDGMQHRIIYINELPGSESADYSIRTAQSEGDLILMMPIKDPNTGDMETVTKRVKGPVGFLITTTKSHMFDENETRNFSIFSDDSPELTKAIGDITVRKAMGEEFKIDERELNLWKNTQRLLNADFRVIIPYAQEVFSCFPDKPVRIRRDRERFRVLIEIVTLLHQFHRKQDKMGDGRIALVSTLADYHVAKAVAEAILTYTIYEIGPSAEELWVTIGEMADNYDPVDPTSAEEFSFKYKDIADKNGWKVDKVKKWMYTLIKCGLIDYSDKSGGGKGKASIFKVSKVGIDFSTSSLNFLPPVESLFEKYPCDEDTFYNPITGGRFNPRKSTAPAGLIDEEKE
jgi:hypothetical protein